MHYYYWLADVGHLYYACKALGEQVMSTEKNWHVPVVVVVALLLWSGSLYNKKKSW